MKVLLLIAVVVVAANALTEEQKKRADEHTVVCSEKVGLDYNVASQIRYAVLDDEVMEQRCFSKCFLERSGFIDAEGSLQPEVVMEKLKLAIGSDDESVEMIGKLIDTCGNLKGDGDCMSESMMHNCYWKHIKGSK